MAAAGNWQLAGGGMIELTAGSVNFTMEEETFEQDFFTFAPIPKHKF